MICFCFRICSLIKIQKTGCKSFEKAQDIEDKFDALCDFNDIILDRIVSLELS